MAALTKEEFFALPTNKKTVKLLENIVKAESIKETKIILESTTEEEIALKLKDIKDFQFFAECALNLKEWIYTRRCIKSGNSEPASTKNFYESVKKIKELGYRKSLVLPF